MALGVSSVTGDAALRCSGNILLVHLESVVRGHGCMKGCRVSASGIAMLAQIILCWGGSCIWQHLCPLSIRCSNTPFPGAVTAQEASRHRRMSPKGQLPGQSHGWELSPGSWPHRLAEPRLCSSVPEASWVHAGTHGECPQLHL